MRKLGDLALARGRRGRLGAGARRRHPGRGVVPAARPADDRGPRGRDRDDRGDVVRAALHRAPAPRRPARHRVRQAQALRPEADPRQPRLPAGGQRRRAAARRADRAGVPADRRAHRRDAPAGRPRGARPRRPRTTPSTCRARCATANRSLPSARRSSRPTTRCRSTAATPRSGGSRSTSCSRSSSGMVGRRRQRGRDSARPVEVDEPTDGEPAERHRGIARPEARPRGRT